MLVISALDLFDNNKRKKRSKTNSQRHFVNLNVRPKL